MRPVKTKRPTVLLLERVPFRAPIARVLESADFEVVEVDSSLEALETLEAREDVDVLLADLDAAGAELSRSVHERWPALGLVLTSTWVRHLRPDEVPGNGCFLPHPVPADTLLSEVRHAARHF